jgi:hypothetical protein
VRPKQVVESAVASNVGKVETEAASVVGARKVDAIGCGWLEGSGRINTRVVHTICPGNLTPASNLVYSKTDTSTRRDPVKGHR